MMWCGPQAAAHRAQGRAGLPPRPGASRPQPTRAALRVRAVRNGSRAASAARYPRPSGQPAAVPAQSRRVGAAVGGRSCQFCPQWPRPRGTRRWKTSCMRGREPQRRERHPRGAAHSTVLIWASSGSVFSQPQLNRSRWRLGDRGARAGQSDSPCHASDTGTVIMPSRPGSVAVPRNGQERLCTTHSLGRPARGRGQRHVVGQAGLGRPEPRPGRAGLRAIILITEFVVFAAIRPLLPSTSAAERPRECPVQRPNSGAPSGDWPLLACSERMRAAGAAPR